ncbi:MAG TPA: 5-formyltetrahydrofolate cyclo-ligase [Sphingobacteriaceae bacterium]
MLKTDLRKEYLEKRKALTRRQYWTFNEDLFEHFKTFNWNAYKTVHVFLPIAENKEIDTFSALQYFKEYQPEMRVVIPRTDFKNLRMENVLFDPMYTILGKNKYGIPEPIHGKIIPSEEIDVVLMPLLAFDIYGNRVGYGKGFYDRFLSGCRQDIVKLGLSFFEPVQEITDLNEFDNPLSACVTPQKIWDFRTAP